METPLKLVGGLKGLESKKETNGQKGELGKLVVEKILMELKKNYTHVPQNLAGMDNHVKELMGLLQIDSCHVRVVGIHGMGCLGSRIIVSRWLITIGDDDVLWMDVQLRDFGRQNICEEGLHLPGKQIGYGVQRKLCEY